MQRAATISQAEKAEKFKALHRRGGGSIEDYTGDDSNPITILIWLSRYNR